MRSRRDVNTEETVAALVRAGRARFAEQGYDAASLEDIAADARVTTGAIYHHFSGKKGLFLAVAEQIETELLAKAATGREPDPWRRTEAAFVAMIDACAAPEIQRIIFLDAPRVIGPEAWREIELKYAYGAMSAVLTELTAAGVVRPYPISLVAPMLLAVLAEVSRAIALDPGVRDTAIRLFQQVLNALRV
jgi:AcrR family transcriptional regulator